MNKSDVTFGFKMSRKNEELVHDLFNFTRPLYTQDLAHALSYNAGI